MARDPRFDNTPVQLHNLSPAERADYETVFKSSGNLRSRGEEYLASGRGKPKEREAVEAVLPHLTDVEPTIASAATARKKSLRAGARGRNEMPGESIPGAGWYFTHHAALRNAANAHGFDTGAAITASAVMSPQNSPENEKAAVTALMHAHRSGTVTIPSDVHDELTARGVPLHPGARGQTTHFADLHPDAIAALSDPEVRDRVRSNVDLKDVARGGSRTNIAKAIGVLRGTVHPDAAIDPHSSPKVFAYRDNIRDAVPETDTHREYMLRASDVASKIRDRGLVGQQMFDYYDLRGSQEGLLSGRRNTAEDTWMNSISHAQPNVTLPGTSTNVMKTAGTVLGYPTSKRIEKEGKQVSVSSDPRIKPATIQHAVNNAATIKAAADISKELKLGYAVPSVLGQEGPWVEERRQGGKDPEYTAYKESTKTPKKKPSTKSTKKFEQGTLF